MPPPLISPAHSPADYEPSPAQMRGMATADIYFGSVGVPFETVWLKKFAAVNPAMRIVATDAGSDKQPINRYETTSITHHQENAPTDKTITVMITAHGPAHLAVPLVTIQAAISPKAHPPSIRTTGIITRQLSRVSGGDRKTKQWSTACSHTPPYKNNFWFSTRPGASFADAYGLSRVS
ncbi:MAG: hypothetical protein R2861_00615 [Desulfobacterales bacterium]